MCTVSWRQTEGGVELFCNRDERRTRGEARGPSVGARRGVRYVAPTDADQGGSWVGANQFGLVLCLLNLYEAGRPLPAAAYRSRGLLVKSLFDCRSVGRVRARVAAADLRRYQPFTLLALRPGEAPLLARWDGARVSFDEAGAGPLISSSFEGAAVAASRRGLFRKMADAAGGVTPRMIEEFQKSHEPEAGPFSVCMHRDDAATVSFSRVRVTPELVEFSYQPGPPCAGAPSETVRLPRAADSL